MRARLQRLRAELRSDRAALDRRLDELADVDPGALTSDRGARALVAVAAHHAYSAAESIFVRLAAAFEEGQPSGVDWHKSLLEQMGLDIEGVRPAVLSPATLPGLRQLLAFRHFFRHAYTVELDAEQLVRIREAALRIAPLLNADLDRLDALLAALVAGAGGAP